MTNHLTSQRPQQLHLSQTFVPVSNHVVFSKIQQQVCSQESSAQTIHRASANPITARARPLHSSHLNNIPGQAAEPVPNKRSQPPNLTSPSTNSARHQDFLQCNPTCLRRAWQSLFNQGFKPAATTNLQSLLLQTLVPAESKLTSI